MQSRDAFGKHEVAQQCRARTSVCYALYSSGAGMMALWALVTYRR